MLYTIVIAFLTFSCNDDETVKPAENKLITIAHNNSNSGKFSVNLLAADTLFEGYNKIFLELIDSGSGKSISEASVSLHPLMHMISKTHAAPVENPDMFADGNGYFEGSVVFLMPSNPNEGWTLDVAFETGNELDTVHLVIPKVKNLVEPRKINVISAIDEKVYIISLVEPTNPEVGVNSFELTVHYKENMMSFPSAEDLSIEINPEMPSMDHGSPNNENPVHIDNGHYMGKVNFTMTGWWRVNLTIKKNDEIVTDDAYFDITFQ